MSSPSHYPLAWPDGVARTVHRARSSFKVSMARALSDLEDALRLFGQDTGKKVAAVVISSNVTLGRERPADPGIAVYFEWDGAGRCIAVDRYATPVENVRAVYHILEARRQEMRHGGLEIVRSSFRGFLALPAAQFGWREVLGLGPSDDLDAAERSYRARARTAHPDKAGGSSEAMARLNEAIAAARRDLGKGRAA
ncbi:MAG TPA: J domain-containing protein [Novosphingobium sp.]|jgi:hypothetical protein|nr:J domain-containing protein [Novosphingobium sp.]